MKRLGAPLVALLAGLVLPAPTAPAASPATASAATPPTAKELLEAAVERHGGAAALAAMPALERKGTVESLSGRGAGRRTDLVLRDSPEGWYRRESTFEFRGRKTTAIEFYDGTVVKRRFGSTWDDLPTDEAREAAAHRHVFLARLDAAAAEVEGEATEGENACWALSVPDGDGRATLWLAKDDGRLVAMEYPATSAEGMGTKKQVRRKVIFRDHRKVGGLLLPFDVESSEDGTPEARQRFDSIRVLPAFDAEWVKLPDPTRRFTPPEELTN